MSTEIKNCSRIIRAILISPFWTCSCCQTRFPTLIKPMLYLWKLISKMKFNSPEFNCSIFSRCNIWLCRRKLIAFFDTSYAARVGSDSAMSIHFLSCIGLTLCVSTSSLFLWFCFCLWSGCNNLDTCLWRLLFMWICRNFCIVVIWIDHVFVRSKKYSDPRLRIILTLRQDSNFNIMFAVLKNWLWLLIQAQFSCFLEPILLVVKLDRLGVMCIRDKPLNEIV